MPRHLVPRTEQPRDCTERLRDVSCTASVGCIGRQEEKAQGLDGSEPLKGFTLGPCYVSSLDSGLICSMGPYVVAGHMGVLEIEAHVVHVGFFQQVNLDALRV